MVYRLGLQLCWGPNWTIIWALLPPWFQCLVCKEHCFDTIWHTIEYRFECPVEYACLHSAVRLGESVITSQRRYPHRITHLAFYKLSSFLGLLFCYPKIAFCTYELYALRHSCFWYFSNVLYQDQSLFAWLHAFFHCLFFFLDRNITLRFTQGWLNLDYVNLVGT